MGISPVERTIPCNLKVPESPERGNTRFFAPMHDFIVTLEVGGDEDNFSFPVVVCFLEDLHRIRTSTPLFRVPKEKALGPDMTVNKTRDGWAECLFLVAADPDEIPVWALQAGRKCGAETSSSANTNAALVESGGIGDTSEFQLSGPECAWWVIDEAASKVTLDTTNHVVVFGVGAFTDDTEGMVLHDARPGDTSEETLLHATFEANDSDLWRRKLNIDGNFTNTDPRESDQDGHEGNIPEFLASNNVKTAGFEFLVLGAVGVAEDNEDPGTQQT